MRTIIIHPTALLREGLRSLLIQRGHDVVGDTEQVTYAHALVRQSNPDIIFLGVGDDQSEEVAAIRQLRMAAREVKIVVLSSFSTHEGVDRAIEAGADGYLLRSSKMGDLDETVERVMTGAVDAAIPEEQDADELGAALTPREREVVSLLAGGNRTRDIARRLSISEKTVDSHRQNIKKKLGLDNLASITKFAIRQGLSSLLDERDEVKSPQTKSVAVG